MHPLYTTQREGYIDSMAEALDDDVVQFLLHNPGMLDLIKRSMRSSEERTHREQLKVMQPLAPVKTVPCGTYGCTEPKPLGTMFCESCYKDYLDDPDAYK